MRVYALMYVCINVYRFQLIQRAHQSELDKAFNLHISGYRDLDKKGVVCQFGKSTYYRKLNGATDNTGMINLEPIPARWSKVPMD